MALNEEEQEILDLINGHPLPPTDELQTRIIELARFHIEHEDDDKRPMLAISPCILIALVREIIQYRNRYGLLLPTSEKWLISAQEIIDPE